MFAVLFPKSILLFVSYKVIFQINFWVLRVTFDPYLLPLEDYVLYFHTHPIILLFIYSFSYL